MLKPFRRHLDLFGPILEPPHMFQNLQSPPPILPTAPVLYQVDSSDLLCIFWQRDEHCYARHVGVKLGADFWILRDLCGLFGEQSYGPS